MIQAMIIDDEPLAHDVILTYSQELPFLTITEQYYSATQALEALHHRQFDLIFLDIQMPVLSGLELLSVLKHQPRIIITSAFQEYAVEGFNLDVTDYLLKPFTFERFLRAVNKVQDAITIRETSFVSDPSQTTIVIKVDKKWVQVDYQDITRLEAYGNYVKVWRDQQCLLTARTLSSFEQALPVANFIRVHKSAIINRHYIDYIEGDQLCLKNGDTVNIGKQYRANLGNWLTSY